MLEGRKGTHVNNTVVADDPILDDLLQLLFRDTERRVHFVESMHEVAAIHSQIVYVVADTGHCADLIVGQGIDIECEDV